jgi:uncharacterized coiled-coil DUF342 family protein
MKYLSLVVLVLLYTDNLMAQKPEVNRKIDTVFLGLLEEIKKEITVEKSIIEENKTLKENKLDSAKKIARLEKKINDNQEDLNQTKQKLTNLEEFKQKQVRFLEQEIAAVVKSAWGLPKELLQNYSNRAGDLGPKNAGDLSDFIRFSDSILSIKKFFEREYDAKFYRVEKARVEKLAGQLSTKSNLFPKLKEEVDRLKEVLDRYCVNTDEVYTRFQKIYSLRKDFSKTDAFREELKKLTYYATDYPFLYDLINRFVTNEITQEEYKDRKISCINL